MKLDSNIETDRLLQRYARHKLDASSSGAADIDTSHLDTDELVAYAENALPDAARARYTSHLSDCDSCRKLVTELVVSSGVAVKLETKALPVSKAQTRSWRDWLAVIFAPRVLGYAASVILLVGIATIALVVFQSGWKKELTNNDSPASKSANEEKPDGSVKNANDKESDRRAGATTTASPDGEASKSGTASDERTAPLADVPRELSKDAGKATQEQAAANPPPPPSAADDGLFGERSEKRDTDSQLASRRQPATEVDKVAAKKKAETATTTGQLNREMADRAASNEDMNTEGAKVAQGKPPSGRDGPSGGNSRARGNAPAPPKSTMAGTSADKQKSRIDGMEEETTRVAGGKQFVRRDGAWVDVAYRSQATTNVRRGSDQYRALVADEPGLRTIAGQLGGDIIVVWKGRAYRIH